MIIRKLIKKLIGLTLLAGLIILPSFSLVGCSTDYRTDSEVYSCYYYAVDGEDMTGGIVYYTLELRTDNKLITRYKTKENKDSGKDDYYIDGDTLVVSAYYGSKKYDMVANEIIISEYLDGARHLLARFRLTQTNKNSTAAIYSAYSRIKGENDVTADIRYFIVSFDTDGRFSFWYRDNMMRESVVGTYLEYDWGYRAIETPSQSEIEEVISREWVFEFSESGLVLEEAEDSIFTTTRFRNTNLKTTEE